MISRLLSIGILLSPTLAHSAYINYNSVLIGEHASGLGGTYQALSGDSSSSGFHNPASLVKLEGTDISASATVLKKYDSRYGESANIVDASERISRGFFKTVPSAIGNVYRWRKWAFGFSVIVPDYDFFSGPLASNDKGQSFLTYTDESLWSGVVGSYKASKNESFGISLYYTARSLIRSTQDRAVISPTHEIVTVEEKSITHNAIVAVFGYLWDINDKWSFGTSIRTPALTISGEGSFYRSTTDTNSLPSSVIQYKNIRAETYIPPRYSLGFRYSPSATVTLAWDAHFYPGYGYRDMAVKEASDLIQHVDTWNASFGFEWKFNDPHFSWRSGVFTNNSSQARIPDSPIERMGERINMIGFSSNINFLVSEHSSYTLGGYYSGGAGKSVQRTGNQLTKLHKNHHTFSLLISTSYSF